MRGADALRQKVHRLSSPRLAALTALRAVPTFEGQQRGMLDALAYGLSLGITPHDDRGGLRPAWLPNQLDSFVAGGPAGWNPSPPATPASCCTAPANCRPSP